MTVREAAVWASGELAALSEPRHEVELLLCGLTGWERHRLYLEHESTLPPAILESFMELVARRKNREPLQHLLGESGFFGRIFACGSGALIPRPETESLLEAFMGVIPAGPSRLLDAGTGSGVIGISLALELPRVLVAGTDVSREALVLAAVNRTRHGADNYFPVLCDLAGPFSPRTPFDGIIANLPYVCTGELDGLEPEVRDWDPGAALDGGPDGLDLVRRLVASAPPLLAPGGVLALEIDPAQAQGVVDLLGRAGWSAVKVIPDLSGRDRVVIASV
jgi:release factor glutamine methyltransferase